MGSFDRWAVRIAEARTEEARRALLAEIGVWRAGQLTDIAAQRDAAYAMARLHDLLGDDADARREAQALASLCEVPPVASDEDRAAVDELFGAVGLARAPRAPREPREPRRKERAPRERAAPDPLEGAVEAAGRRHWEDALRALHGVKGRRADQVRTWVLLARALDRADPDERERDLGELEARLRARALGPATREAEPEPAPQQAAPEPKKRLEPRGVEGPLSELVGRPVSRSRSGFLRAVDEALAGQPPDKVASAALRQHVEHEGLKAPAPWLVGAVARALAHGEAPLTREVLRRLGEQGAYAVSAYDEEPFEAAVALLRAAMDAGHEVVSVRRGLGAAGEPARGKLWTVRLARDGAERMAVLAPPASSPIEPDLARRLVDRMAALNPLVALRAPGSENAALREAAAARGLSVLDQADAQQLRAALEAASQASTPQAPPPRLTRRDREERALNALREALQAGAGEEALVPLLQELPRVSRGLAAARDTLAAMGPDQAGPRVATLLRAVDRAAPPGVRPWEGVTLALRFLGQGADGLLHSVLLEGSTAERYGGPGMPEILKLTSAIGARGWQVERVLRGPTGRERRESPVLQALGRDADGLWRLVVRRGEVEGEVWYVADLGPEGRAALPHLWSTPRPRAVVLPVEPELLSWYKAAGGPEPIGWTGEEVAGDVAAELERWAS